MEKISCVICGKYKKFKNSKYHILSKKTLVLSIICSKCESEDEKIFKEEQSMEILRILGSFKNI